MSAAAQTTGYHVVFQRNGGKAGELFWAGTLEETWALASKIAPQYGADIFRIAELTSEVGGPLRGYFETRVNPPAYPS